MKMPRIVTTLLALGTLAIGTKTAFGQVDNFIGEIKIVGFNFAPIGWALCQGQTLSIQQNNALFSLLGTTYGGDGIRTFALPDLRGRVAVGMGGGPGLTNRNIGEVGGAEEYTLTIEQLPAHTHPITAAAGEASVSSPSGAVLASKARVPLYSSSTDGTVMAPTGPTGGGQPYSVMPPYLVVNYIIALEGIFPSRG
jgi:microcystin-dependent protein